MYSIAFRGQCQRAIFGHPAVFFDFANVVQIALDGPQHAEHEAAAHDASRTAWLESQGFRAFHFWNHELDEDIRLVVEVIEKALGEGAQDAPP
jgi:very-short-patch-repair endonuclease